MSYQITFWGKSIDTGGLFFCVCVFLGFVLDFLGVLWVFGVGFCLIVFVLFCLLDLGAVFWCCFFVSFGFFLTLTGNIQMRQLIWPSVTSAAQPLAQAGTGHAGLALWSWDTEGQEGTLG